MYAGRLSTTLYTLLIAVVGLLAACDDASTVPPAVDVPAVVSGAGSTDDTSTGTGATKIVVPDAAALAGSDGRSVGTGVGFDATARQVFGTRTGSLPVPAPLPTANLVTTKEGFLSHAVGARLYRAGNVIEGERVSFNARLVNVRKSPVRIQRIEGECECIEVFCYRLDGNNRLDQILPGGELRPGEEFELQVHLDTTGRDGLLQLEGILDYAGADMPLKFGILANVRAVYRVEPEEALQPKRVLLGHAYRGEATITSPIAARFSLVLDRRSLPKYLKLDATPLDPDQGGFAASWKAVYEISADAPDQAGLETFPVVFEVLVPPSSEEALAISHLRPAKVGYRSLVPVEPLQAGGEFGVQPAMLLDFGRIGPNVTVERRVFFKINDTDFHLEPEPAVTIRPGTSVGPDYMTSERIAWRYEKNARGALELVVSLTGDPKLRGPLRGVLDLTIGHPQQESMTITITALVR